MEVINFTSENAASNIILSYGGFLTDNTNIAQMMFLKMFLK